MPDTLKTSLIIIISQLPLVCGGWLLWTEKVRARPLYAALVGGGYELLLLLAVFAGKVWKDLEKDAVRVTADWVRGVVRGFAPGFRRRYRKQVMRDHGVFNVRGLGLINTYTLNLEQVFVDLRIDPSSNPQRFNVDPIARKEPAANRPIWDFLRADSGLQEATALAVVGPPGCGKTTLLQHVAVTLAANRQRRHGVRAYAPVLLFLRDHVRKILSEQPPSLGRLAQDYFGDPQLFPTLRTPPDWFERRLEGGKCMLLLDGLDEVADADERRAVSAWVDAQIRNYPRCPFVLTARPQGYADAPLQRAHVLEVQPFSAGQVRRFVENWYLANEVVASGGREDEGVRQRARKDAEDLLRRLRATPSLDALTVNPLLLTMIAMVHRYHGALPGSRVELYDEICEVLLGRWRQSRGVHDPLKTGQKLLVLRPLAAHMMEHKIRDVTAAEAAAVIAEPLKLLGGAAEAPEAFLNDLQAGSGLLLEREAGRWSFAHLTFQEYLTAAHWLEEKEAGRDWRALVGSSWWHETLRLYAAQGDATRLLRACLDAGTVPALALAADFLEEARGILPEVRREAERCLIEDLEAEDPERRRLAAEVRLTRRLRNLQRIDERREIDPGFVTCAEYQLFLDDMGDRAFYYRPDHRPDAGFAKGDALKPVAGVRPDAAETFCSWLRATQGGAAYRLPRPDEVEAHAQNSPPMAAWCRDESGYSLVGLADGEREALKRLLDSAFPDIPALRKVSRLPVPQSPSLSPECRERAFEMTRAYDPFRTLNNAYRLALDYKLEEVLARVGRETVSLNVALSRAKTFHGRTYRPAPRVIRVRDYIGEARNTVRTLAEDVAAALELSRANSLRLAGLCSTGEFDDPAILDHLLAFSISVTLARDLYHAGTQINELEPRLLEKQWERQLSSHLKRSEEIRLYLQFRDATSLVKSGDLQRALDRARAYEHKSFGNQLISLLDDCLEFNTAGREGLVHVRRRVAVARILSHFYAGCEEMRRLYPLYGVRVPDLSAAEQAALEIHWWLRVVIAREQGGLSAWEGIRIVREQAPEGAAGENSLRAEAV